MGNLKHVIYDEIMRLYTLLQMMNICCPKLRCLIYITEHKIVHGDIKPEIRFLKVKHPVSAIKRQLFGVWSHLIIAQ